MYAFLFKKNDVINFPWINIFPLSSFSIIQHRVSTIMNADTIWVLSDGEIIECDSPANLLANVDSTFYNMVQSNK